MNNLGYVTAGLYSAFTCDIREEGKRRLSGNSRRDQIDSSCVLSADTSCALKLRIWLNAD